jgi:serine/threonine-protein kinase SRPK3
MWSLKNVFIEKYHLKVEEAEMLASFIEPMLVPYPEKRMTAAEALRHPWLQIKETDSYTGKMTEDEYKEW